MKHYLKVILITSAVMLVSLGVIAGLLGKGYFSRQNKEKEVFEEELDMNQYGKVKRELGKNPVKTLSKGGKDGILTFSHQNAKKIYNVKDSKSIKSKLEDEKAKTRYNFESPLWAYNPYGTNELSLYVYFKTADAGKLKYTIQVKDDEIPDFTRTCYSLDKSVLTKEHEYQIIGLVPDKENYIYFDLYNAKGEVEKSAVYRFKPDKLKGNVTTKLMEVDGKSGEQLSNGLYFFLGHDSSNKKAKKKIYLYDNSGVVRGAIPLVNYRADKILFQDENMLYNYSDKGFAVVNSLGQVVKNYQLGGYKQHHDFVYDGYGNLLILATKEKTNTLEDRVISLNLEKGTSKELIDLGKILPKMKKKASKSSSKKQLNWLKLNSIAMAGSDSLIVSSKELSSLIKINGITSVAPSLGYIIGPDFVWDGTKYANKVYKKTSEEEGEQKQDSSAKNAPAFASQFGQSDIKVINENGLGSEQYYITMYNNNYGNSDTRKDLKWSDIKNIGTKKKKASTSKYYKYYVDESNGTYQLVDTFQIPYSSYDSSIQDYKGNFVVNSGTACSIGEYDKDGVLIHGLNYNVETNTYRVYKYDMKNFWFQ